MEFKKQALCGSSPKVELKASPVQMRPYKWIIRFKSRIKCIVCSKNVTKLFHNCNTRNSSGDLRESESVGWISSKKTDKEKRQRQWQSGVVENYKKHQISAVVYEFYERETTEPTIRHNDFQYKLLDPQILLRDSQLFETLNYVHVKTQEDTLFDLK